MELIRIELSGRVVKPPKIGVTPSGRAVLRLSVDCGDDPEHLLLEVVLVDNAARDLARMLGAGRRMRAAGTLRAVWRGPLGAAGRQQMEVIASEIVPEQVGGKSGSEADLSRKLI
jgi:Single-strand binding protein family